MSCWVLGAFNKSVHLLLTVAHEVGTVTASLTGKDVKQPHGQ